MSSIKEHEYLKICAQLASCLSISIAAAKKKVDLEAAKKGLRDIVSRKELAQKLLEASLQQSAQGKSSVVNNLDNLLKALAQDENFMVED